MPKLPTQDDLNDIDRVLHPYFLALGKVAHSWNHLQEELGKVFCAVTQLELHVGMGTWYGLKSDRSQRDILRSAVAAAAETDGWKVDHPEALQGLTWLLNEVNALSDKRNDAIHAPCNALLGNDSFELKPITFYGNKLAAKLSGKDILSEFTWYQEKADALWMYARQCRFALDATAKWPEKPLLPTQRQK